MVLACWWCFWLFLVWMLVTSSFGVCWSLFPWEGMWWLPWWPELALGVEWGLVSVLCLSQPCWGRVCFPTDEGTSQGEGTFPLSQPLPAAQVLSQLPSPLFSLILILTGDLSCNELVLRELRPSISMSSEGIVLHIDVFLMCLVEGGGLHIPILISSLSLSFLIVLIVSWFQTYPLY